MKRQTLLILIATAALVCFAAIASDAIYGGPLRAIEVRLASAIDYRAHPQLTPLMLVVTNVGSAALVSVVAAIAMAVLLRRQQRRSAMFLVIAVYGGMLLNAGLKQVFRRARPLLENPILVLETYSFPSGHAVAATVLYGGLAMVTITAARTAKARNGTLGVAIALILATCLSRIYLGVHHLSDVLAGMMEGFAWLIVCHGLTRHTFGNARPTQPDR